MHSYRCACIRYMGVCNARCENMKVKFCSSTQSVTHAFQSCQNCGGSVDFAELLHQSALHYCHTRDRDSLAKVTCSHNQRKKNGRAPSHRLPILWGCCVSTMCNSCKFNQSLWRNVIYWMCNELCLIGSWIFFILLQEIMHLVFSNVHTAYLFQLRN